MKTNAKPPDALTYLGCDIVRRATESFCCFVILNIFLTHAEISNFYVPILVQQYIIQLQIAVNDATGMQKKEPDSDFSRVKSIVSEEDTKKGKKGTKSHVSQ